MPYVAGPRQTSVLSMKTWFSLAVRRDVVARAASMALVVGPILIGINQGDLIVSGALSGAAWVKMLLTVSVPYCVSTYSSVGALRAQ